VTDALNPRDAVILSAARTPVGTFGGVYRDFDALSLAVEASKAAVERSGIGLDAIDEIIFGSGGQPIEFACIARQIGLKLGAPLSVPAYAVQRNCASGVQSISNAVQSIAVGDGDIYLVGGTENMSMAPYYIPAEASRWGARLRHRQLLDANWIGLTDYHTGILMGETAENLVREYGILRAEQGSEVIDNSVAAHTGLVIWWRVVCTASRAATLSNERSLATVTSWKPMIAMRAAYAGAAF